MFPRSRSFTAVSPPEAASVGPLVHTGTGGGLPLRDGSLGLPFTHRLSLSQDNTLTEGSTPRSSHRRWEWASRGAISGGPHGGRDRAESGISLEAHPGVSQAPGPSAQSWEKSSWGSRRGRSRASSLVFSMGGGPSSALGGRSPSVHCMWRSPWSWPHRQRKRMCPEQQEARDGESTGAPALAGHARLANHLCPQEWLTGKHLT